MADSSLLSTILAAVPVMVGGILAITGGVASQFVIHRLMENRDQAKLRREHIENLVRTVLAQSRWIADRSNKMIFRNEDHDEPWPLDEARVIQKLYFPELAAEVHAIHAACIPIVEFINEQRLKHMKDRESFIANYDPVPFNDAYKRYLVVVSEFTDRCRKILIH